MPEMAEFVLKHGRHTQDDPDGVERTYKQGQRFMSNSLLVHEDKFKFERVHQPTIEGEFSRRVGETPQEFADRMQELAARASAAARQDSVVTTLTNMSFDELKRACEDSEIEVEECDTRETLVAKLTPNADAAD